MHEKYTKLRDERGLSDYQVSKETGIPRTTLSEWAAGKYEPKVDKIQKIANYFGVGLGYFYGGEEK